MELVNQAYLCLLTMYPEDVVKIIVKEFVYNLQKENNKIVFDRVLFKLNQKIQPDFFENWYFSDPEVFSSPERIQEGLHESYERHNELKYYHLPIKTKEDCYQILVDSEKRLAEGLCGYCWEYTECVNLIPSPIPELKIRLPPEEIVEAHISWRGIAGTME